MCNLEISSSGQQQAQQWVRALRQQREELLVRLSTMKVLQFAEAAPPPLERMATFCQRLVDYLCRGHFQVYLQLLSDSCPPQQCRRARRLCQGLSCATEHALFFNDKYDTDAASLAEEAEAALAADLQQLARVLLFRLTLEEQLIEMLLESQQGN